MKNWPTEHDGFKTGDKVRVEGERGTWEWVAVHMLNDEPESYAVRSGRGGMRFFRPARVTKKKGRR